MTETEILNDIFEQDFFTWIQSHEYPSGYRKEPTMKKLAMRHINAVTRAQHLLETGVDVDGNKRLRKSIEKDILLLTELREIVYQLLENPTLPFDDPPPGPPEPMFNAIEDEPVVSY